MKKRRPEAPAGLRSPGQARTEPGGLPYLLRLADRSDWSGFGEGFVEGEEVARFRPLRLERFAFSFLTAGRVAPLLIPTIHRRQFGKRGGFPGKHRQAPREKGVSGPQIFLLFR